MTQGAAAVRRYRWTVLAVGTTAQATFSVFTIGLPVMLPEVRSEYGLTLAQTGLLLAAANVGTMLGMLPWGVAADRVGERWVVERGPLGGRGRDAGRGRASSFGGLCVLLALAGLGGASVAAASGRAVMHWFPHHERGLAMGIRQSAIPVAGAASALVLPLVVDAGGVGWGFAAIGIGILAGAALAAAFLRDAGHDDDDDGPPRGSCATGGPGCSRAARRCCSCRRSRCSASRCCSSTTTRACRRRRPRSSSGACRCSRSPRGSAPAAGRTSSARASGRCARSPSRRRWPRSRPRCSRERRWRCSRRCSCVAGVVAASWNGLAFAAAAEAVDRNRVGAALGVQQTVLFGAGAVVAPLFAALVDGAGWSWGFAAMAVGPGAGVRRARPRGGAWCVVTAAPARLRYDYATNVNAYPEQQSFPAGSPR